MITLNEDQRDLILTLLPEALAKEGLSEIDLAGGKGLERLFVKALENVQGDERDIVLISMTYGPDRNGRFLANLGVLSQPGAAKRVNVLATRSKWKTVIYHSFDIGRLDANTSAGAVAFLQLWNKTTKSSIIQPTVIPASDLDPEDDLDTAFKLMDKRLKVERFSVHRFPRFIAGYERDKPHRYIICFYFTGLYAPLQKASDIARLKGAGWVLRRIPADRWRADPSEGLAGIYQRMVSAALKQFEL
nr:hypothetical protein [Microvirga sp. BSC39]